MSIQEAVSDLMKLKEVGSSYLSRIEDVDLLIDRLDKLNELVEMEKAKETICEQLKYLIVNSDKNNGDNMLNAIITGDPGVGKTVLATKLAGIWNAMGLINKTDNIEERNKEAPILISNSIFEKHINNLKSRVIDLQNTLITIKAKSAQTSGGMDKMEDHLEELRKKQRFGNYRREENFFDTFESVRNNINTIIDEISRSVSKLPDIDMEKAKLETKCETVDYPIEIVTREDLVAGYLGQTAIKTKNLLEKCRGKVLFIDEAYLLYNPTNSGSDPFGMEALTTLNEFMSRCPNDIIVIFAGYKDKMEETIFRVQPGLKRRCMWTFDIEGYTPTGLAKIFEYQLKKSGWKLHDSVNMVKFFEDNLASFSSFGGDTEKLVYHCKLAYSRVKYALLMKGDDVVFDNLINNDMIVSAFHKYKDHAIEDKDNNSYLMYM